MRSTRVALRSNGPREHYDLTLFTFLIHPIGTIFGLTKLDLSYALGASLAASAVGGIVFGALADLYGRRRVLEWTIVTYSLGTLLSGLTGGLGSLILFRLVHRSGRGWRMGDRAYLHRRDFSAALPGPLCCATGRLWASGARSIHADGKDHILWAAKCSPIFTGLRSSIKSRCIPVHC